MTTPTIQTFSIRIAEITAQLAEMKRAYFVDGIEAPMSARATLEAEMANLRLEKLKLTDATKVRQMQVRQLRGEILRKHLSGLGFPNLMDECNELAESQIPETV
jgi:cell division protein FtsL